MGRFIAILFIVFLCWMVLGVYFIYSEHPKAHLIMGLGVSYMAFILMPLFIFYRYKNGKYKKYQVKSNSLFNQKKPNS